MARQLTQDLFDALMLDMPLRPAMIVDFGLNSNGSLQHSALQRAVRAGATVEELDDALGDGSKLSKLVQKQAKIEVPFHTPYDDMRTECQEDIAFLEAKKDKTEEDKETLTELYEMLKRI